MFALNAPHSLLTAVALVAGLHFGAGSAVAATINGSDFTPGLNNQVIGGITWTSAPGNFALKTMGGFTGVGITGGRTEDEIDIGETLAAMSTPVSVVSLTLGVLFDGPEFGDVNEVAQVTVNGTLIYTLTAVNTTTAVWTGLGSVTNLSPADGSGGGAVWQITNPFGAITVTSLSFTALPGVCGVAGGACNNQSDFTLVQLVTGPAPVEPVPAPAALLLLGTGLFGLGLALRRR